jgi:hypothetical protein
VRLAFVLALLAEEEPELVPVVHAWSSLSASFRSAVLAVVAVAKKNSTPGR